MAQLADRWAETALEAEQTPYDGQTSSTNLLPTPCTMPRAIALNTASTVAQLNRLLRFGGGPDSVFDVR